MLRLRAPKRNSTRIKQLTPEQRTREIAQQNLMKKHRQIRFPGMNQSTMSVEEAKARLKEDLKKFKFIKELSGEAAVEERAQRYLKPKKAKPTRKRKRVNLQTNPLAPKILEFFKETSSKRFKTKFAFLNAFSKLNHGIKIGTSNYVLQELIRSGQIPNFGENKTGRKYGTTGEIVAKKNSAELKEQIELTKKAQTSPLFMQARKFGNQLLIDTYRAELAKPAPSKEKLKEIELVFKTLNPAREANWLSKNSVR